MLPGRCETFLKVMICKNFKSQYYEIEKQVLNLKTKNFVTTLGKIFSNCTSDIALVTTICVTPLT